MTPNVIAAGWLLCGLLSLVILIESKKELPPSLGWFLACMLVVMALGPFHLTYLLCRLATVALRRFK